MSTADTTAPTLKSLTFPSTINVGSGGVATTFSAHAEDSGSGIDDVVIWFDKSLSTDLGSFSLWGLYSGWTDSTPNDAASTWAVNAFNNPGVYSITKVDVSDLAGNKRSYSSYELNSLGISTSFTVIGSTADTTAPTLKSLTFPSTINVGSGGVATTFSAHAEDSGSGIDDVVIWFDKSLSTDLGSFSLWGLYSGWTDSTPNDAASTWAVNAFNNPGVYSITKVDVSDLAGNKRSYSSYELNRLGISTIFTVNSGETLTNHLPTGAVTISGAVKQGQTLTASNTLADVDGLGMITYQWLADGVAILGASGSTFTLMQAQVGKALSVKASYTDGQGTAESVASSATLSVVKAAPSVAFSDYNGDGKADLRWVKDSGEVSLWLMNGANPTATANFGPFNGWSVKDSSQDFNGDGKTDLLWSNANGAVSVWTMDGLNATSIADHGPYAGWQLVDASGDYNGDGKADLRWVKDSGEVSLWLMNGTVPTASANFGPFNGWTVKDGSQDFNGDGKTDLLWSNANGAVSVWTMDGLNATSITDHGPYAGWQLVDAEGDYNGDGKADLRWVKDNGEVSLWLMNGTVPTATANFGPFNGWSVQDGSQDFNGDGKSDLLWSNTNGAVSVWTMDGLNATSITDHGPYVGWQLVDAAGDYNGDGKADLRWVKDNGEVSLWLMNGTVPTATANFGPFNGWSVQDGSQDFNGDGKSDLLWSNTNGAASVWTMDGLASTAIVNHGPYDGWRVADLQSATEMVSLLGIPASVSY